MFWRALSTLKVTRNYFIHPVYMHFDKDLFNFALISLSTYADKYFLDRVNM